MVVLLVGLGVRIRIVVRLGRRVVVGWLRLLNSRHLYVLRLLIFLFDTVAAAMTLALSLTLAQALATLQLPLLLELLGLNLSFHGVLADLLLLAWCTRHEVLFTDTRASWSSLGCSGQSWQICRTKAPSKSVW